MSFRTKIRIGKKWYYAERDSKGRFTDITNIGDSIGADSRKKTRKKVKLTWTRPWRPARNLSFPTGMKP